MRVHRRVHLPCFGEKVRFVNASDFTNVNWLSLQKKVVLAFDVPCTLFGDELSV